MQNISIIRPTEARVVTGCTKTRMWSLQQEGLMVKPIRLGPRSSGYLKHEIDALIAARAAGCEDAELINLVKKLELKRKQIFDDVMAELNKHEAAEV
ncbi:helix-turn-helix transcriptional regulator [Ningiella sp. W23]|uniref:helix-turn-helix transcriptional regulator n=1 Tax=Ningiella sp. W23 TaxID=3023715 RepID=UPI0037578FD2